MSESKTFSATGRRKNAIAHAWIVEGTGEITVNKRAFEDYLPTITLQNAVLAPFQVANLMNKFDVRIATNGGGLNGQVGAMRLAIARALIQHDPELRPALKAALLLRRDPRMKERKKAGQPGARKRFQFSKR
ncbi:30S ribosomal protein S9 [Rubritalea marina]|uniref:30S ribosomal protein S9 n=1 Tax=Rubritalea marina TaxID=361055 RepID=UPI000360AC88|nr:30S ribosomal protein S9 [Rubritalea marina]